MTACLHAEPYAAVTRRERTFLFFRAPDVYQLSIPRMPDGTRYDGEFNTLKELTHFIETHLPGKSVQWKI